MTLLPGRLAALLQDGIVATATPLALAGRTGRLVTRVSLDGDVVQRLELPRTPGSPPLGIGPLAAALAADPGLAQAVARHHAAVRLAMVEKAHQARLLGRWAGGLRIAAMLVAGTAALHADISALGDALAQSPFAVLPWLAEWLRPLAVAVAGLAGSQLVRLVVRRWLRRMLARWTGSDPRAA
jgi:hypothetical protein